MFTQITTKKTSKLFALASIIAANVTIVNTATATVVEFQTSQGNIQVNLFDQATPETVANFLSYVNSNYYNDTVIHRVVSDFVIQGGGYEFNGTWPLTQLVAAASVINEPIYSNVSGTIAMAKLSNDANSATDQWFFNLADNSSNLDVQNDGFTVFGQVINDGMTVINKIAQLTQCENDTLSSIPMAIDDEQQCADLTVPGIENFVVIEQVIIIDSSAVTEEDLTPIKNTLINADEDNGGSTTLFSLLILTLLTIKKRFIK